MTRPDGLKLSAWDTSSSMSEHVDDQKRVRFWGFELQWAYENRLKVAQPSYTRDLLQRHGVKT